MKKFENFICFLFVAAIVGVLVTHFTTGWTIPEIIAVIGGEDIPTKDKRALYDFEQDIAKRKTSTGVSKPDWDTSLYSWEEAPYVMMDLLNETPENYFIDWKNTTSTSGAAGHSLNVAYFEELMDGQGEAEMERAADSILSTIPDNISDWDKARLIHDALIRHITYKENPYDQTAYGALVKGEAVCNGYAMAYEYLLNKVGIPCDTVTGYSSQLSQQTDSIPFPFQEQGLFEPGKSANHAWNIVTFHDNGIEKSYFVDVTWDDFDKKNNQNEDYISYNWFCVTMEDLLAEGRSMVSEFYNLSDWNLSNNSMNYYFYTGNVIESYDRAQITQCLQKQMEEGKNILSVRMPDLDSYHNVLFPLEDGDLSAICSDLGLEGYARNYTYDYIGDGILCLNIFTNYPESAQN